MLAVWTSGDRQASFHHQNNASFGLVDKNISGDAWSYELRPIMLPALANGFYFRNN